MSNFVLYVVLFNSLELKEIIYLVLGYLIESLTTHIL